MSQSQDPLGNQQPQPPSQPYQFPQAGYEQPNLPQQPGQPYNSYNQVPQQQQNQYPQVGYFGGAPEPKRGMPWWSWVLIVVGALIVIGAIVAAIKPASPTASIPTSQISAVTTVTVVASPTQRITTPTVTVAQVAVVPKPTPSQRPIPTALPSPTALPAAAEVTINGVHTVANVNTRTPGAANSVFFIVDFTVVNSSKTPLLTSPLYFKIQSKQSFSYEYSDVTYLLPKGYKSTTLAPNETTRGEIAFEVPSSETIVSGRYEDVFGNKVTKPIG